MKYLLVAFLMLAVSCTSKSKKTDSPTPAPAQKENKTVPPKSAHEKFEFDCRSGDIKRNIKIIEKADHCSVEYTKDSSPKEIATGASHSTYCVDVATRLKSTLTSAGYKCE